MATERDISEKQFRAALRSYGMTQQGFMGYVELGIPGHTVCVSHLNAGPRRRAKLAYLLSKREEAEKQISEQPPCPACNAPVGYYLAAANARRGSSICPHCNALLAWDHNHGHPRWVSRSA
jgi:hypothetical protein